MKNTLIAASFVLIIILANAVGTLIDQKEEVEIKLQTEIEKSSDLEMVLEDRFISDYLRRNISK